MTIDLPSFLFGGATGLLCAVSGAFLLLLTVAVWRRKEALDRRETAVRAPSEDEQ